MSAVDSDLSTATVRIFTLDRSAGIVIPRRGAVKVWTGLAERRLAAAMAAVSDPGRGPLAGLVELSLQLDTAGEVTGARISTSSGHEAMDAGCLTAAAGAAPLPPPPGKLLNADVIVLVELVARAG